MLESFTLETFLAHSGEPFRLRLDSSETMELELVEATEVRPSGGPAARSQFSIVFRGPSEPVLAQRIYAFEHDELGAFEIFIVPIGRDEAGTSYEAAFG
jgi:hypothetical protein